MTNFPLLNIPTVTQSQKRLTDNFEPEEERKKKGTKNYDDRKSSDIMLGKFF